MSEQPKKKGLTFKAKAKLQEAKPGELRVAPRAIINLMPEERKEETKEEEAVVPSKPIVRNISQPGSRLLFGKKKGTPGLPLASPAPTPVFKPTVPVVGKPKKQVQILSEPTNVRIITPVVSNLVEETVVSNVVEETIVRPPPPAKKVSDPALLAVKAEFDALMELYGDDTYELVDLSNIHDEERDEERVNEEGETEVWEFYFFQNPIENDFTNLNAKFTTLEFTEEGFFFNQTDTDVSNQELGELFDMFREVAEEVEEVVEVEKPKSVVSQPVTKESKDLRPLEEAILREEGRVPGESLEEKLDTKYRFEKPVEGYSPTNRRNFTHFITEKFAAFQLPPLPSKIDPNACQTVMQSDRSKMYLYQEFVKEYLSWQTPYRGILVYHGLGSGKTCTSIAAAEALFATANRKIIVMTPFSLRQNFIGEITTCGFRHYRLKNHWTSFYLADPAVRLFATSVLRIPDEHLRKVTKIWVPDFSKPSNYETLDSTSQTQIREQINAILVWDPTKGLNGRIWFISYNGITAKELLKIACQRPKDFDDAVIIIDEIHNLIRIMQGTIEPYLVDLGKKVKRKIPPEPVTWRRWEPVLCPKDWSAFEADKDMQKNNYKRGYLFYRLLTQAQNSKIIGLSGTPLINFPEELGILSNVLHGYIHIVEGNVARPTLKKGGSDAEDDALVKKIRETISNNPFVDFYEVEKVEKSIRFRTTFLPEGIRKVPGKLGVERVDPGEPTVDFAGRLSFLESELEGKGIPLMQIGKSDKLTVNSQPLLPPIGKEFNDIFINARDFVSIENPILLIKRLTGLISYYRGSRDDLMPKISKDETVRIPMSSYQQTRYSELRLEEITIEEEKEKKKKQAGEVEAGGRLAALYAEVYEIKNMKQSSNYRMASRQICNFAFPAEVSRPRPKTKQEQEGEAGEDVDILDAAPAQGEAGEDLDASLERAKALEDQVKEEEENIGGEEDEEVAVLVTEDEFDEGRVRQEAIEAGFSGDELEEYVEYERNEFEKKKAGKPVKTGLTPEQKRCRATRLPGETKYQQQIDRAKECLRTIGLEKMKMGPTGLGETSPKFQRMLENIAAAKGSSLVYSQFLQMEGIGIFSIAMEANGYEPIEIKFSFQTKQVFFSQKTKESLLKGPSVNQMRYITFTGAEESEVRKYALLLFNGRFSELPKDLAKVLSEGGWKNNDFGSLCRVFCITSAGAEGLSLKNVRAVHIMEPYWNDVRMAQVKGRAVRICSHAELPLEERTVDVYTYVSVFSDKSQVAREGEWQISEKIRNKDSLNEQEARLAKLPIPAGALQYTLTSDERLWLISNRKKALIDNLQSIMKSAAVDCKLNQSENKEVSCAVFEKVGDFMYDPDFRTDLEKTVEYQQQTQKTQRVATRLATVKPAAEKPATVAATVVKPQEQGSKTYFTGPIDDVTYSFEPVYDPVDKTKTVKYLLYDIKDTQHKTVIGEIGAKESKQTKGKWVPDKKTFKLYSTL
jgi:hypothetical protein